ncbi:MAG: hypothetical protein D6757_10090 [Alphaproteobacteria bacterium]|nr:MAG: hypothetical protein D6757_10090 [Alphaproteobacteria bacterium]
MLRLHPHINPARLARRFREKGRVQIHPFLEEEDAKRLFACLSRQLEYILVYNDEDDEVHRLKAQELAAMAVEERRRFLAGIHERASRRFQFFYGSYLLLENYLEGRDRELLVHRYLEFINSPPVIELLRAVTDIPELIKADAQVTRYGPHHFLTRHDDLVAGQNRRVAMTLHMTPRWRPDWGGYLQFFDANGDIEEAFQPRFNCLNLFRVPMSHAVQYVSPFAGAHRYAITGWCRDG